MKNVFISYAREDANWASRLKTDLEQAGHTCWLDTSEILGGDEWVWSIATGIEKADAGVSLISDAAQHSDWMLKEFLFAKERDKPIIPLLIEDCPLPLHLVDRQGVPLYRDYQGGLNEMRPEFELLRRFEHRQADEQTRPRRFDDVVEAVRQAPRLVLLGEPGAGKTTALWRLAADKVKTARANPPQPLPVLVSLGKWTKPGQPLTEFIRRQLGDLGQYWDGLLQTKRAVLLLDGLNEMPTAHRPSR